MATSTYYEVIPLSSSGNELETVATENNFSQAVKEALLMREAGDIEGDFSIVQTVRDGDEAEHFEVAYVSGDDPDRRGHIVLRIVDFPRIADYTEWDPNGGRGKHFTMLPFYAGGPERRQRVVPMADPGSLPGRNELMHTIEHLPHYFDTTYRNDVSPSRVFAIGGRPYKLFIAPGRITARSDADGAQERQYALFEIDRAAGQDISEAIADDDVIWDHVVHSDDPKDVMDFIAEHSGDEDASAERFRLLELETGKRRSARKGRDLPEFDDTEQRFALLDLGDDPAVNPARRRRGRRNPDDIAAAKEKFEEFHRHKPRRIFESGRSPIPAKVRELGKAKAVLYRSDKNDPDTGRPVKKPIDYIHDHDAGVMAYTPAAGATVAVPAFIRDAEALVLLGKCLGFDFDDGSGKVREAKGIRPLPDLYATPCGKALLVIQDRTDVLAIIWGGGLGVEARGIVG